MTTRTYLLIKNDEGYTVNDSAFCCDEDPYLWDESYTFETADEAIRHIQDTIDNTVLDYEEQIFFEGF